MNILLREFEPRTVGDLKDICDQLPADMELTDGVGELACIRIYKNETDGTVFMGVQ